MAQNVNDSSFQQDVLEYKGFVLVDFWAEWCGPCRQLGPIIDELSIEMEGKIKILKMNIDQNPNTPSQLGVRGIPALILFQDGKQISNKVGSLPKTSIINWLREEMEI